MSASASPALAGLRELLRDDLAAPRARTRPATSTCSTATSSRPGCTQDLMVSRLVPAIYERYWRPALGQVAKGLTGPGMAEEVRIARLLLGLGEGDAVLDVACGPGNFSREFARAVGADGLVAGIDASRTMLERGAEENRRAGVGNLRADPRRRDRAAVPRRRASTPPAASPPCTCSPTRSPRSTRCAACSRPAAGSR